MANEVDSKQFKFTTPFFPKKNMDAAKLESVMKQVIQDFDNNAPNLQNIDEIIYNLPYFCDSFEVGERLVLTEKIFKIFAIYVTSKSFNLVTRRGMQRLMVARQSGWSQKHLYKITLLENASPHKAVVPDLQELSEFIELMESIIKSESSNVTLMMLDRLKDGLERYSVQLKKLNERSMNAVLSMARRAIGCKLVTRRCALRWGDISRIIEQELKEKIDSNNNPFGKKSTFNELGKSTLNNKSESQKSFHKTKASEIPRTPEEAFVERRITEHVDNIATLGKGETIFKLVDSFLPSILKANGQVAKVDEGTIQEWENLVHEIGEVSKSELLLFRRNLKAAFTKQ